jgi:hypothetical protein
MVDSMALSKKRAYFLRSRAVPYLLLALPAMIMAGGYTVLSLFVPIGRDSGVFMYSGRVILNGGTPYLDAWDHKGPLIYFFNAIGLALAGGNPRGVIIFEGLLLSLSVLFAVRIWAKLSSPGIATIVGIAFVLSYFTVFANGNFSETWLVPFSLMAYTSFAVLVLKARGMDANLRMPSWVTPFLIGFAGAVALTTRPNNGIGLLVTAILLVFLSSRQRVVVTFTWIVIGGLIVVVPALLYLNSRSAIQLMLDQYYHYNVFYTSEASFADRAKAIVTLTNYIIVSPLWLLLIISVVASRKNELPGSRKWGLILFYAPLLMFGVANIDLWSQALSGEEYRHYAVVCLPPLAVAAMLFILNVPPRESLWSFKNYAVLAVVGITVFFTLFSIGRSMVGEPFTGSWWPKTPISQVTHFLSEHTHPEEKVLMYGYDTSFLVGANRFSPTSITYLSPVLNGGSISATPQIYMHEVMANKPRVIVRAPSTCEFTDDSCRKEEPLRELRLWITSNYAHIDTISGYEIWEVTD